MHDKALQTIPLFVLGSVPFENFGTSGDPSGSSSHGLSFLTVDHSAI
jgi:hypothetical protein